MRKTEPRTKESRQQISTVMSYSTAAVTGVCGEFRWSWNCTWTAFKSILDAARSHKILPFISYLLLERQKDGEGGKKKKWAVIIQQNVRVGQ